MIRIIVTVMLAFMVCSCEEDTTKPVEESRRPNIETIVSEDFNNAFLDINLWNLIDVCQGNSGVNGRGELKLETCAAGRGLVGAWLMSKVFWPVNQDDEYRLSFWVRTPDCQSSEGSVYWGLFGSVDEMRAGFNSPLSDNSSTIPLLFWIRRASDQHFRNFGMDICDASHKYTLIVTDGEFRASVDGGAEMSVKVGWSLESFKIVAVVSGTDEVNTMFIDRIELQHITGSD